MTCGENIRLFKRLFFDHRPWKLVWYPFFRSKSTRWSCSVIITLSYPEILHSFKFYLINNVPTFWAVIGNFTWVDWAVGSSTRPAKAWQGREWCVNIEWMKPYFLNWSDDLVLKLCILIVGTTQPLEKKLHRFMARIDFDQWMQLLQSFCFAMCSLKQKWIIDWAMKKNEPRSSHP